PGSRYLLIRRKPMPKLNFSSAKLPLVAKVASVAVTLAFIAVASGVLAARVTNNAALDRVQITILGTTDLHGNIDPIDYYTNKPDNRGLAKIATLIKR